MEGEVREGGGGGGDPGLPLAPSFAANQAHLYRTVMTTGGGVGHSGSGHHTW